jgi:hypothetical protein
MVGDGLGAGIQAGIDELGPQLHDRLLNLWSGSAGTRLRPTRLGFQRRIAACSIPSEQPEEPATRDRMGAR